MEARPHVDRRTLARDLYRVSHLRGSFRLRSGRMADEYFDKYLFESDPALLRHCLNTLKMSDPAYAVAVGDTPFDARAATAIGMHSAGVRTGGFSDDCSIGYLADNRSVRKGRRRFAPH